MCTPLILLILIMTFYSHNNTIQAQKGSRDSVVGIVTRLLAGYPRNCGSIHVSSKRVFSSPKLPDRLCRLPSFPSNGHWGIVKLTTHLHLMSGLRKIEAVNLLPHTPLRCAQVQICLRSINCHPFYNSYFPVRRSAHPLRPW
jgi:hypothetical protein